jgi:hypothetical protein
VELERITYAERPDLAARLEQEEAGAFPEFLLHDEIWNECWPHLLEEFADLQYVLYDRENEALVGGTNAVPLRWDGDPDSLPTLHDVLRRSIDEHARGIAPNTICGVQTIATRESRGQGLSEEFVAASKRRFWNSSFEHAITPLRMLLKHRYPLIPIEEYVEWQREDGEPFEPWVRIWVRAGAEILRVVHDSIIIDAPIGDWERWTGLELPGSGEHVIEGAQTPVVVDRHRGNARYSEPHLWIRLPRG